MWTLSEKRQLRLSSASHAIHKSLEDEVRWGCVNTWEVQGPEAVVIYTNQPSRMQASASQDKNRRKPGHNEGAHNPDYENIILGFRNKDQLKPSQSAPTKQAKFKSTPDTAQIPPWLHRTIMFLYVLLALILSSCIVLSALVLVKNSEMSRELWGLKMELSNVSTMVLKCQEDLETIKTDIVKTKSSIHSVTDNFLSGNNMLKMVLADITQIKKTLEALEKKANPPSSK